MNFHPTLALFIGLGAAIGIFSCLLAVVVEKIDAMLTRKTCSNTRAARHGAGATGSRRPPHSPIAKAHTPTRTIAE